MHFPKISVRNIKLAWAIYEERSLISRLLESKNFRFLKYALPGHFYSPVPDLDEIATRSRKIFNRSVKDIPSIDLNEKLQLELISKFFDFYGEIPFLEKCQKNSRYYFDNGYFSYGDGVILYSFLRYFKPRRIIEVGSGFSSAEMLDINDRFFSKTIQFTFIEPYQDRLLNLVSAEDKKYHRFITNSVQDVSVDTFLDLSENDILFIDSSHVVKSGSDVMYIVSNILPLLKKGVIIHFHDIIWPFEYPEIWFEAGRAFNEAYFLKTFLQYNQTFEIMYFSSFMEMHHTELLRKNMPLILKVPSEKVVIGNTSLWIRKMF